MLKKVVSFCAILLFLSGCAVPVPLQIASWALDGISLLTTKKSVTDHGISIVAQKDCAVWRGVVEGKLCREIVTEDTLVASKSFQFEDIVPRLKEITKSDSAYFIDPMINAFDPEFRNGVELVSTVEKNIHDTYSVSIKNIWAENQKLFAYQQSISNPFVEDIDMTLSVRKIKESENIEIVKWKPPIKPNFNRTASTRFKYFVIGSFRTVANANRLTKRYNGFELEVIATQVRDKKLYRVVLGPITEGKEKEILNKFREYGIVDSWPIQLGLRDWVVAESKNIRLKGSNQTELAYSPF